MKIKSYLVNIIICGLLALISPLVVANVLASPRPPTIVPSQPKLAAKSYLLVDFNSDRLLAEHDIDKPLPPASLTKMMTMYVVDQELKNGHIQLTDKVRISKKAWRAPGSRMFLEVNSLVTVEELIHGVIIQSGNDASIALAEHIAGSEQVFVTWMNSYAETLGMKNTHFTNATGMPDPKLVTTARDMGLLAKALIRDFPETYEIYSKKSYTHNGINQPNRNRLLWRNPIVDGIKTGHTDAAGFCLVASGKREDMRLIAVIMGAKNDDTRTRETNKLISWGFRFFETHKLYPGGEVIENAKIWMGQEQNIPIGVLKDMYVTISQGQYKNLQASVNIPKVITAPKTAGSVLGSLTVKLNDEVIAEHPVVALANVNSGSLMSRLYDYVSLSVNALLEKANFT